MCRPFENHKGWGHGGCGYGDRFFPRLYISREEERDWLEKYREELKKELAGVEERLKELKKVK